MVSTSSNSRRDSEATRPTTDHEICCVVFPVQVLIVTLGILWSCSIALAIVPIADQLSTAESYLVGARSRGESISPKMQEVLQKSRAAVYPLQLELVGVVGMSAAIWFLLNRIKNRENRRPHPHLE